VTAQELRKLCLGLPGTREEFPFRPEVSVFKVGGKIFAISTLPEQPLSVSVKCEPGLAEQLRATHPAIVPGYHLNKRHWITITADGSVPDTLVADLVTDSYHVVAAALPRATKSALGLAST
jgi:predicted DNA-binding protein (MmcQ/YjbR family)